MINSDENNDKQFDELTSKLRHNIILIESEIYKQVLYHPKHYFFPDILRSFSYKTFYATMDLTFVCLPGTKYNRTNCIVTHSHNI